MKEILLYIGAWILTYLIYTFISVTIGKFAILILSIISIVGFFEDFS